MLPPVNLDCFVLVILACGFCSVCHLSDLNKMGRMEVIHDLGFLSPLGYLAYCRSRAVDWLQFTFHVVCTLLAWPNFLMFDCVFCLLPVLKLQMASQILIELHQLSICFCIRGLHSITDYAGTGASVADWVLPTWAPGFGRPIRGSWGWWFW